MGEKEKSVKKRSALGEGENGEEKDGAAILSDQSNDSDLVKGSLDNILEISSELNKRHKGDGGETNFSLAGSFDGRRREQ